MNHFLLCFKLVYFIILGAADQQFQNCTKNELLYLLENTGQKLLTESCIEGTYFPESYKCYFECADTAQFSQKNSLTCTEGQWEITEKSQLKCAYEANGDSCEALNFELNKTVMVKTSSLRADVYCRYSEVKTEVFCEKHRWVIKKQDSPSVLFSEEEVECGYCLHSVLEKSLPPNMVRLNTEGCMDNKKFSETGAECFLGCIESVLEPFGSKAVCQTNGKWELSVVHCIDIEEKNQGCVLNQTERHRFLFKPVFVPLYKTVPAMCSNYLPEYHLDIYCGADGFERQSYLYYCNYVKETSCDINTMKEHFFFDTPIRFLDHEANMTGICKSNSALSHSKEIVLKCVSGNFVVNQTTVDTQVATDLCQEDVQPQCVNGVYKDPMCSMNATELFEDCKRSNKRVCIV